MNFWALALLFLAFLSKLSLAFFGAPSRLSVMLFQHGLHPYMNIILNFLLGLPVLFYMISHFDKTTALLRSYRSLVFLLLMLFFVETLLQYFFMEGSKG